MPGLGTLDDRAFIRAFQVTDRVIQNRQPVFVLVWVGSVAAVLEALALGLGALDGGGACCSSRRRSSTSSGFRCRRSR